jgi:hypothetical protein
MTTQQRQRLAAAVAQMNRATQTHICHSEKGEVIATNDGGLWIGHELYSHPKIGPALADRDARQRQQAGG